MRTPALDPAAGGQGTGVQAARGDGADPAGQSADVHRSQALGGGAVTELAVVVEPPALDPAAGCAGASVNVARGDGADPAGQSADVHRREALGGGAVTELAVEVYAPALDPAASGAGAGVLGARRSDGSDPAGESADVHRGQALGGGAVTELAEGVAAPALDPAAGGEGAGVIAARGDGADPAGQSADVHRREALGGGAVTEQAACVVAPALDPTAGGERASVT